MDPNQGLYPRRQATAKTWAALIAAAAAVLVLVALIALVYRSGQEHTLAGGSSPDVVDADGAAGATGQSDGEDGLDTAESAEGGRPDGGTDGGEPAGGGPGSGGPGGPGDGGPDGDGVLLTGLDVVRERHAVPAHGYLRKGVRCPEGTVVFNGGFDSLVPDGFEDPLVLQESTPGTVGGGAVSLWLVSVRSEAAIEVNVDLYAVCADPPPGYEVIRGDASMDPSRVVEGLPTCPDGKAALGGGAQVVGAGSADFRTTISFLAPFNHPPGTFGWRTVIGNGTAVGRTVGFRVVCANAPAGFQMTTDDAAAESGSTATAGVSCPAGTVIGGGLGPLDHDISSQRIHQTHPEVGSHNWVATLRNPTPFERTFRFWALCAQTG
jgi:hypothetical protein